MKQSKIYRGCISVMALFLVACSEEELPNDVGQGYLSMGIAVENASTNIIYTKAYEMPDTDIHVEILKDGLSIYNKLSMEVEAKIKLEPGDYTLNIYSDAARADDKNSGPRYEYSDAFTIEEGKTTNEGTITMQMRNFGVALSLPESFDTWFTSHSFTVTVGESAKTLDSGETVYFDLPEGNKELSYQLDVTNTDGERQTSSGTYPKRDSGSEAQLSLTTNAIYLITYDLATKSWVVR